MQNKDEEHIFLNSCKSILPARLHDYFTASNNKARDNEKPLMAKRCQQEISNFLIIGDEVGSNFISVKVQCERTKKCENIIDERIMLSYNNRMYKNGLERIR